MANSGSRTGIAYADGKRIRQALRAAIHEVINDQEILNKINVFPVPDGDTGTNLALTLGAVLARLARTESRNAGEVLSAAADAALDGARGNSGAITAQYLQGLADFRPGVDRLGPAAFAGATSYAAAFAREAMDEPREGTILSVIHDFSTAIQARSNADPDTDFVLLLKHGLAQAERSLADTPRHLEVLRKAGVVDAGAQGFVDMLRGIVEFIDTGTRHTLDDWAPPHFTESFESSAGEEIDLSHRFCSECMVTGDNVNRRKLREAISALGSSMVVAGTRSKVKVHIHVNDPHELFETAAKFGKVSGEKADDMRRQQKSAHALDHGVAVLSDSAADLPDAELERLNINLVPVRLHFGERSYLDKIGMTPDEFYDELQINTAHPKTSQPAPGDFRRQYQFLASHYRWVISVHVSAAASGTWQAAKAVAERTEAPGSILVFDSRNASVGQGLLCAYAAELASGGLDGPAIFSALEAARANTHSYIILRDLTYGVRGGRVPAFVKTLADLLRLTAVLTLRPDGSIGVAGVLFGRRGLVEKFARFVLRRHRGPVHRCRLAVGHAHCPDNASQLMARLKSGLPGTEYSFIAETGPALGVHAGPGAMVVSVQTIKT